MISQVQINKNSHKYYQLLEECHQQHKQQIRKLQNTIHDAARKIQKKFREYIQRKKYIYACKIQKFWRKKQRLIKERQLKQLKFKKTFYIGKIIYFLRKKLNLKSQFSKKIKVYNKDKNFVKDRITFMIGKLFPRYICVNQTLQSQYDYINKLKVYESKQFNKSWKIYEQSLIKQIQKEIKKKWIQKNTQVFINKQNRQVNIEKYIEMHLNKIYQSHYAKFSQNQQKLFSMSQVILNSLKFYQQRYLDILCRNI